MIHSGEQVGSLWHMVVTSGETSVRGTARLRRMAIGSSEFAFKGGADGFVFDGFGSQSGLANPPGASSYVILGINRSADARSSVLEKRIGDRAEFKGIGTMTDTSASFQSIMIGTRDPNTWTLELKFVQGFTAETIGLQDE